MIDCNENEIDNEKIDLTDINVGMGTNIYAKRNMCL